MKRAEMIGKKFGRLTVTRLSENTSGKRKRLKYYCDCDCGTKDVEVIGERLRSGGTKSCGCYARERKSESHKKYNTYDLTGEYGIGYASNTNKEFYFDLEDYEKIKKYCWLEIKGEYIVTHIWNTNETIYMHRLIMNAQNNEKVDHIKHKKNDNRKSELRICTQSQNGQNRSLQSNNVSGITGVCFINDRNLWNAEIMIDQNKIYLGQYKLKEDAIKARRDAEEKYFGEWSYKNSVGHYNSDL